LLLCRCYAPKKIPISSQKQPQRAANEQTLSLLRSLSLTMLAAAVVVVAAAFSLH